MPSPGIKGFPQAKPFLVKPLAPVDGQVLTADSTKKDGTKWAAASSVLGDPVTIGHGGTGAASLTNHGVVTAGASALTTVAPSTSGNVLTSNGTDWTSAAAAGGGGNAVYGDGSDGALAFDGIANPVAGATLSGSTYTLTRDLYASSISITTGVTIFTNGFAVFCTGNCGMVSGSGVINFSGNPGAATGLGGVGITGNTITGSVAGGNGHVGAGSNGNNTVVSVCSNGGAGGSGSGGAGGGGGVATQIVAANGGVSILKKMAVATLWFSPIDLGQINTGGSGGGGGGDGASGAGGGASGGGVLICSKTFSGTIAINAKGGDGGSASLGTNTGGGGGGGGGAIVVITSVALPGGVTLSVAGGAKGNKKAGGTGNDGVAGSTGNTYTIIN